MPEQPDASVVALAIRAGDQGAMADLFRSHGDRIYNYCYRRTASWAQAEDLTSEVFLTAWRTHQRAAVPDEALLPWLYSIATNVLRNHLRSQRRGVHALRRIGAEVASGHDNVTARMGQLDADARVRAALDRLAEFPQSFQDVFLLVVWEGLSYEDAAAALNCPVGTVRSRLSRVRQALRLSDEVTR